MSGAAAAALRPDLVRRLVPVAGLVDSSDEYLRQLVDAWLSLTGNPEGFGRLGTLAAYNPPFLDAIGHEMVEQLHGFMRPTEARLRQLDLLRRLDIRELLPKIEAPTLVIGCTQDRTVPVANHRELAAGIAGSEYIELDSGHVVPMERPDEFVRLVQDFFARP
ncbi:Possible hydrolase%2C alpha/beta fold [Mycobacterium tuberculosis]|nr:Possible hydrolase%2C alpha/beta fold [Mycobacterium tuberculosis]